MITVKNYPGVTSQTLCRLIFLNLFHKVSIKIYRKQSRYLINSKSTKNQYIMTFNKGNFNLFLICIISSRTIRERIFMWFDFIRMVWIYPCGFTLSVWLEFFHVVSLLSFVQWPVRPVTGLSSDRSAAPGQEPYGWKTGLNFTG